MLDGPDKLSKFKTDGEYQVFPGYGVWALLVFLLFLGRGQKRKTGRYWLVWALVFALLSFGPVLRWGESIYISWLPNGYVMLPGVIFDFFPVVDGYRVFARMGMLVLFCMAVFVGLNWERVEELLPRRAPGFGKWGKAGLRYLAVILAAILIMAERVDFSLPVQEVRLPEFYRHLSKIPNQLTLCEFPTHEGVYLYPMTAHRHRLVNYYVSRLGEERKKQMMSNAFLWFLYQYGHPYPNKVDEPAYALTPERFRKDFETIGVDGVVMHLSHVNVSDRSDIHHFFAEVLELKEVYRDEKIVFFWNVKKGEVPGSFIQFEMAE